MPIAKPDGLTCVPAGKGMPVLVLHAWWGLNIPMKVVCARLGEAGFFVFAPDLYHKKVADTIEDAEALATALDSKQAKADIADATQYLIEQAGQPERGVAVIGFSMGADYALDLSAADPEHIRSVVLFYGTGPADFGKSKASYLGHFAEKDAYEPKSNVDELEVNLRDAGRPVTFHHYQGTGHWFFESNRPEYNEAAATLAWDRTLLFLSRSSGNGQQLTGDRSGGKEVPEHLKWNY